MGCRPARPWHTARLLYDFLFYVVVIVCLLNIVFGIIIDTFGQLRTERESVQRDTQRIQGHTRVPSSLPVLQLPKCFQYDHAVANATTKTEFVCVCCCAPLSPSPPPFYPSRETAWTCEQLFHLWHRLLHL